VQHLTRLRRPRLRLNYFLQLLFFAPGPFQRAITYRLSLSPVRFAQLSRPESCKQKPFRIHKVCTASPTRGSCRQSRLMRGLLSLCKASALCRILLVFGLRSGRAGPSFRFRPKGCKVRAEGAGNSRRERYLFAPPAPPAPVICLFPIHGLSDFHCYGSNLHLNKLQTRAFRISTARTASPSRGSCRRSRLMRGAQPHPALTRYLPQRGKLYAGRFEKLARQTKLLAP
jgi:hypothetical protein